MKKTKTSYNDYSAFGEIDNLSLSREELFNAVNLINRIINSSEEERSKILFKKGINNAKSTYEKAKQTYDELDYEDKVRFKVKEETFDNKMKELEPLLAFVTKFSEIFKSKQSDEI